MSTFPQRRPLLVSDQVSHTSQQASRSTVQTNVPAQIAKKHPAEAKEPALNQTSTSPHLNRGLRRNDHRSSANAKPSERSSCHRGATDHFSKEPSTAGQNGQIRAHVQQTDEKLELRHKSPQLRSDQQVTCLHRAASREESNRSSLKSTVPNPAINNLTNSKSKRRSKTHSIKTVNKPKVQSLAAKSGTRQKKKKTGRSKESSLTEGSDLVETAESASKVTVSGQHGFLKNASTGSDSLESSFTVVNIDRADWIKDVKTTRGAGTSIQRELLAPRGPLSSHRSVGIQADGSDQTPRDAKALFQKLLPRISALSTKRKPASINASGQSSSSDFSNSRSFFGSQSVQSCPERGCTSVQVQYAASGNVKAILRSPSLPSKYSSRSSAIWSGERLTPIIQGVSLSPPRTPPTSNAPKTSKSAPSRPGPRARLSKACPKSSSIHDGSTSNALI